jgi:hypothetical protein
LCFAFLCTVDVCGTSCKNYIARKKCLCISPYVLFKICTTYIQSKNAMCIMQEIWAKQKERRHQFCRRIWKMLLMTVVGGHQMSSIILAFLWHFLHGV